MNLQHLLATILTTIFCAQAYALELPEEARKMLDDLGPPDVQQQNNGKLFKCNFGGTKRVTISLLGDATIFNADYNNCREQGITRDGSYKLMIQNGEIIGKTSKRSINGELFDAVRENKIEIVRKLIKRKADVNYSESIPTANQTYIDDWTPIMWASFNGNTQMIKLLVKNGAWVNYMNSDVVNPLWLAANNGHLGAVKELIKSGAYINNRNSENVTPLMTSAMQGHYAVAKYLIDSKADLNLVHKDNDGDSALMFALGMRHADVAQLLIDSGADINIRNKFGVTALMIAVTEGNEEITKILLDKKADFGQKTKNGMTVLDIANGKGYSKIVEMIRSAEQAK